MPTTNIITDRATKQFGLLLALKSSIWFSDCMFTKRRSSIPIHPSQPTPPHSFHTFKRAISNRGVNAAVFGVRMVDSFPIRWIFSGGQSYHSANFSDRHSFLTRPFLRPILECLQAPPLIQSLQSMNSSASRRRGRLP